MTDEEIKWIMTLIYIQFPELPDGKKKDPLFLFSHTVSPSFFSFLLFFSFKEKEHLLDFFKFIY